jgi:hypothetical protein
MMGRASIEVSRHTLMNSLQPVASNIDDNQQKTLYFHKKSGATSRRTMQSSFRSPAVIPNYELYNSRLKSLEFRDLFYVFGALQIRFLKGVETSLDVDEMLEATGRRMEAAIRER